MKFILILLVLNTFVFSKECYFNKVKTICYYKYFKKYNIHEYKADEEYYIDTQNKIYTFDKTIEVKFNSIGAVFSILNDYGLEFVNKIKKEVYLFKVEDRMDLFTTISKLNRLSSVMKAQPHKKQKFTNAYIAKIKAAKKARFQSAMEKVSSRLNNKSNIQEKKNVGFDIENTEEPAPKKRF